MNIRSTVRIFIGGLALLVVLAIGNGPASAQSDPYTTQPPSVENNSVQNNPTAPQAAVAGSGTTRSSGDALPVTGTDVMQLGIIGGALVAAGAGLQVARRRRA